jgi:ribosomal protein S6--L-glutamate ligase
VNLWILSVRTPTASTLRLLEAAAGRGHVARWVDPRSIGLALSDAGLAVVPPCDAGPVPDAALTRMGGATPETAFEVLRGLEAARVALINPPGGLWTSRHKFRTALALARAGIPTPETAWATPAGLDGVVAAVPGPPWVVKPPDDHQGKGVVRVSDRDELAAAVERLNATGRGALVQRYVAESAGHDLRVVVVGDRSVACMRRRAVEGEFRANLHLGGRAEPVALGDAPTGLAERASAVTGLEIAGVDVLLGRDGPLVLEVNPSPGIPRMERACGIDLAGAMIEHVERRISRAAPR